MHLNRSFSDDIKGRSKQFEHKNNLIELELKTVPLYWKRTLRNPHQIVKKGLRTRISMLHVEASTKDIQTKDSTMI